MSARPILDQVAHGGVIAVALVPVLLAPGVLSCGWAGFAIGLLAEIKERGKIVDAILLRRALASKADLAGYTLAGVLVGLIAGGIAS